MARGKKCAHCGNTMFSRNEKHEPMGTTVWYECQINDCSYYKRGGHRYGEKVFEEKR